MSQAKHSSLRFFVGFTTALVIIASAFVLYAFRQRIVDQITVWQYRPTSQVQTLADRSGMSDEGKFYFYSARPAIDEASAFNAMCDRKEQSSAVLGCYANYRIYIYNINNQQLDGIKEVTAAHEMLHAAYDRLGDQDRNVVNGLLEAQYQKLKDNPAFSGRLAVYERTEPGQRSNELHSIIGTEVANLDPRLEAYYKQYFSDRSKVVNLNDNYQKVFNSLKQQSDSLSARLKQLGSKIEAESSSYNRDTKQLSADIDAFNTKANSGGFTSLGQFNAERAALLARADELSAKRTLINSDITDYNADRTKLQSISTQSQDLYRSIDSSLAPPATFK